MLTVVFEHSLFHLRFNGNVLVGTRAVLDALPRDRYAGRVVGRTAHLVDVPVSLQVAQVAHTGICAHTFYILVVPQGEGIVVTVCEDDGVILVLQRHQIVLSEVTTGVTS